MPPTVETKEGTIEGRIRKGRKGKAIQGQEREQGGSDICHVKVDMDMDTILAAMQCNSIRL